MDPNTEEISRYVMQMADALGLKDGDILVSQQVAEALREELIFTIRELIEIDKMDYKKAAAVLILALASETMTLTAARESFDE